MASRLLALILTAMAAVSLVGGAAPDEAARQRRHEMVERQIKERGIKDRRVLAALAEVPRHLFVPDNLRGRAYEDSALPIGSGQTISQPYIVALMTELLELSPGDRVLEIGTGSGYQAAVLSRTAAEVYTIEILPPLAEQARRLLADRGYTNVTVRAGDGYQGWPEKAPFDAILVTAAPPSVPQPLLDQLAVGGRLVLPVGTQLQDLLVYTRRRDGTFDQQKVLPVRFVPMTGEAQRVPR